jgi:hypothetical protein
MMHSMLRTVASVVDGRGSGWQVVSPLPLCRWEGGSHHGGIGTLASRLHDPSIPFHPLSLIPHPSFLIPHPSSLIPPTMGAASALSAISRFSTNLPSPKLTCTRCLLPAVHFVLAVLISQIQIHHHSSSLQLLHVEGARLALQELDVMVRGCSCVSLQAEACSSSACVRSMQPC